MRYEVITTRDALLALRGGWDALWARSHGDYFTSFASCLAAWDAVHAPAGRRLRCAVAYDDEGRIAGVLPMALKRRAAWRIAVPLGPEAAEGCDAVADAAAGSETAAGLLRTIAERSGADVLDLPYVREGSALERAIRQRRGFQRVTQTETMPCAHLRDEVDWTAYERSLGRQTQAQTARKRRRLDETGMVTLDTIHGAADAEIDWLLDEKARWGRRVGKLGGWLFAASYRHYLKQLARDAGRGQRLATFVLRIDGRIAAVKVIAIGTTLTTLIIAAYDETLSRFSPGNILDEVWVRHVFDTARDAQGRPLDINFGCGVERYKLHWGRGASCASHTFKVAATPWGALPYRAKALAGLATSAVGRLRPRRLDLGAELVA